MSRGFVKEGDQEELPIVPPRAPLPPGMTNYVTPAGHQALLDEREELLARKADLSKANETEHRQETMLLDAQMNLLNERINSSRVLYPEDRPQDEVRFGATVVFEDTTKEESFQIVGVDEADIKKGKIAFIAPLAKALTGKRVGEIIHFKSRGRMQKLTIKEIRY